MSDSTETKEVYTDFVQTKNVIIELHAAFIDSLSALIVEQERGRGGQRKDLLWRVMRSLMSLYNYGVVSRVFPHRKTDEERRAKIENLIQSEWNLIKLYELRDVDRILTEWFEKSGFYSLQKSGEREVVTPEFFEKLFGRGGL